MHHRGYPLSPRKGTLLRASRLERGPFESHEAWSVLQSPFLEDLKSGNSTRPRAVACCPLCHLDAAGPTISFDAILLLIVGLSAYMAVFPIFPPFR